jgi:hypothetical protein
MGENQTAWHDQNLPVFTESLFRILHNDTHRKEKSGIYAVQQSMKVHSKALQKRICTRRTVVETDEIGMH